MAGGQHRRRLARRSSRWPSHRSRRRLWGRTVLAVGSVLLLLVGGYAVLGPEVFRPTPAGPPDCPQAPVTATVVASPDHAGVLRLLAAEWARDRPRVAGQCVQVKVLSRSSAMIARLLGTDAAATSVAGRPDAWAPESGVWAALAATRPDAAAVLPPGGSSLAVSPVVIAIPRTRAEVLGWPSRPIGWRMLLGGIRADPTWGRFGHPEWGPFILGMSDPTRSTPALHTLLALTDANRDGRVQDAEVANELLLERSVARYATDTPGLLEETTERAVAKTAPLSAFPATEQAVLRYDKTAGGTPLVPVYPIEGVPDADHPFLLLDAPWVSRYRRAAVVAFLDFALGGAGRAAYARAGFRDRDRSIQQITSLATDRRLLQPDYPTRPLLAPGPTAQVLIRWRALRYPGNVVAAIDTSGSMQERAPGLPVTKLAVLQKAAAEAVALFNVRSTLEVWEFNNRLNGGADYRTLVPPRPLGAPVAGHTQREAVIAAVSRLHPRGATGLYDTIEAGYREIHRIWRPDQQNILVVMTDGKNEDPDGLDLRTLLAKLDATRRNDRPVTVILIAYGLDADVAALNQVSQVTRGRTYVCRKPTDIGKVFLAAMVNR